MPNENARGTVVVGVDGSLAGEKALRWAVREAARRGDPVRAVSVLAKDDLLPGTSFAVQPYGRRPARDEDEAHEQLHASVRAAIEGVTDTPEITETVVSGDPATELITESIEADLVVVGTHGHNPVAEALLGSVATDCLRHAHCPVVVVTPRASV